MYIVHTKIMKNNRSRFLNRVNLVGCSFESCAPLDEHKHSIAGRCRRFAVHVAESHILYILLRNDLRKKSLAAIVGIN